MRPTTRGHRYVVAAVEYVSECVVAVAVANHIAETVARVLVGNVVFVHGQFRELLTDPR